MSQKANSKKKIIIAAVLAGVLVISAIVSIVLVLAASTQNITSNITISYSVEGVGARVSARYGTVPASGNVTMTSMTTSDGSTSELVFNVSDSQSTQTLTPNGNIALSQSTGLDVVFEYRFQNIAESGFTVGLTTTGEEENNYNITETFYVSASQLETSEYGRIIDETLAKQAMLSYDDILYIYVKVSVANENLSAAYNKAYNWELKQITSEEVTVTLNDNGGSDGLTSVNTVTGAATPILETLPTAPEGQGFIGYYDATSGGTQYISKSGVGIKEITGAITLYAQYSEEALLDISGSVLYGINPTSTTTTITELNVPTSVTEIADSAFEDNTSITSVNFGETATASYASGSSLKKIGAKAFKGCTGLTELVIPEGVTSVGDSSLSGCTSLQVLEFNINCLQAGGYVSEYGYEISGLQKTFFNDTGVPASLIEIVLLGDADIPEWAFSHSQIEKVTIKGVVGSIDGHAFHDCSKLTAITIPSSVTYVGDYAFFYCSILTTITIPSSVTYIGDNAFYECSNLADIYYGGTPEEYANINIGSDNEILNGAKKHYYQEWQETIIKEATCKATGTAKYTKDGTSVIATLSKLEHEINDDAICELCGDEIKYLVTTSDNFSFDSYSYTGSNYVTIKEGSTVDVYLNILKTGQITITLSGSLITYTTFSIIKNDSTTIYSESNTDNYDGVSITGSHTIDVTKGDVIKLSYNNDYFLEPGYSFTVS